MYPVRLNGQSSRKSGLSLHTEKKIPPAKTADLSILCLALEIAKFRVPLQ